MALIARGSRTHARWMIIQRMLSLGRSVPAFSSFRYHIGTVIRGHLKTVKQSTKSRNTKRMTLGVPGTMCESLFLASWDHVHWVTGLGNSLLTSTS